MHSNQRFSRHFAALLACALPLCACGGTDSPSADVSHDELTSSSNRDVQLVEAQASGQTSTDSRIDYKKCDFSDRQSLPQTANQMTASAKADCSDMLASAQERPPINGYHEPIAYLRENPNLSYVTVRHWCQELDVTVAVKAAAWDSPSFDGIGFYGYDRVLDSDADQRRVFYAKDDARLVRVGSATLKSGEPVYLYRFGGAGPCAEQGSGDNPSTAVEFKAFVRYQGSVERWEELSGNHSLQFNQTIDARNDLLQ